MTWEAIASNCRMADKVIRQPSLRKFGGDTRQRVYSTKQSRGALLCQEDPAFRPLSQQALASHVLTRVSAAT